MPPLLEPLTQSLHYPDLPETWRVPDCERFSTAKTMYDYQIDALKNAARALFLYYGKERDWVAGESQRVNDERKRHFAGLYVNHGIPDLQRYDTRANERDRNEYPVFRILSEYIRPQGNLISRHHLINRMCFWMATGSGKTLVMVKLIEYLHSLKKHGEIPPHNMLILAPSEHLLGQIRRTVDEFNRSSNPHIDLVPLRASGGRMRQMRLGDTATVYYHRSDTIADVQKEALTDYRTYENGGRWYVFLDEAHKGGKDDSKRQAYYAIMAREGFLFNFSATFTEQEDIVTTVKKYNLQEFVKNGHGKNIYLNETEYRAFHNRQREISHKERQKIVLKSLVTLAYISARVRKLREETGRDNLYHLPLMLTLVNSVNTDVENKKNDLWSFFHTLREIATGDIDASLFKDSKNELIDDWRNATLLFGEDGGGIIGIDEKPIQNMTTADVREAVFFSRSKGALQFIRGNDNKELAFQMRNADAPFALIRIGDTAKWRNTLLAGFEETTALKEHSFFAGLEKSNITILMGSRSFFESWDSNRPNVINFINIGGSDAKKFVVQSVGRGVRIEPLQNMRRRFAYLLPTLSGGAKAALKRYHDQIAPPETLFLFATNRNAVRSVFEGLETEKSATFEGLQGFVKAPRPQVRGAEMPLLVPEYKDTKNGVAKSAFAMSDDTRTRLEIWLNRTSDSVFAVRDGLTMPQIGGLRALVRQSDGIESRPEKHYAMIPYLQHRLMSHIVQTEKVADGIRTLDVDHDIVHFRKIRVRPEDTKALEEKIGRVRQGGISKDMDRKLAKQYAAGKMVKEEFDAKRAGSDRESFRDLIIKKLLGHYYLPVITSRRESVDYIQHVVTVQSEVNFLNALEARMKSYNGVPWDAWMFSKIDESLDAVHIPWYDTSKNEYRRFLPDFVFWMCRGHEYRIVFVDPKGTEYTSAYRKIDGYKTLFTRNGKPRRFTYGSDWHISVNLLFYNPDGQPAEAYRKYWTRDPGAVFDVPSRRGGAGTRLRADKP